MYFPYGALKGDTKNIFLPTMEGGSYILSEKEAPVDVLKYLGYGKDGSPLGMALEKSFELFVDLKQDGITVPWSTYRPGNIFPLTRVLNRENSRIYAPNGVLSVSSGARSVFMLPNIGCATQHINLLRDFKIHHSAPKNLNDHWAVFKEIIDSNVIENNWRSCLIYFSEAWIKKLHHDKAWLKLKAYLHTLAWDRFDYEHNRIYYDIACSITQKKYNLKPNPYIADTARHLYAIALGAAPGYIPACNNEALPVEIIQQAYVNSYGLKKYFPSIMQPTNFIFEQDKLPIYYSKQHPSTFVFSPKSRNVSSTLLEMRELQHIENKFTHEFANNEGMCSGTVINKLAKMIEFTYYHNEEDKAHVLKASTEIATIDPRFHFVSPNVS